MKYILRNFFYITDLSLPSNKAQAVHIFKMLDNFQDFSKKNDENEGNRRK